MNAPEVALMTVEEVAAYLQLKPETIRAMTRRGQLPGLKVGTRRLRFRKTDIDAWLESCKRSVSENENEGRL